MARPLRINLPRLTFHVVQRGHNRDATFRKTEDYLDYLSLLCRGATRFQASVHAYVLMTNHVHLLLTSELADGVSLLLQYVSGRYSFRFNQRHERSGSLWETRFYASPIDSDRYCLACYRYIELNPVRAGLVAAPQQYRWSSFRTNSRGRSSSLITPHPTFLSLGQTTPDRGRRYRELMQEAVPATVIDEIRQGVLKGQPAGGSPFQKNIEAALQRPFAKRRRGRPPKKGV